MRDFGNLVEGYRRFRANQFGVTRRQWHELAEGQSPRAVIIIDRWMSQIDQRDQAIAQEHGTSPKTHGWWKKQPFARVWQTSGLREREQNRHLVVLGCHFSIREGELWVLDEAEGEFARSE